MNILPDWSNISDKEALKSIEYLKQYYRLHSVKLANDNDKYSTLNIDEGYNKDDSRYIIINKRKFNVDDPLYTKASDLHAYILKKSKPFGIRAKEAAKNIIETPLANIGFLIDTIREHGSLIR